MFRSEIKKGGMRLNKFEGWAYIFVSGCYCSGFEVYISERKLNKAELLDLFKNKDARDVYYLEVRNPDEEIITVREVQVVGGWISGRRREIDFEVREVLKSLNGGANNENISL